MKWGGGGGVAESSRGAPKDLDLKDDGTSCNAAPHPPNCCCGENGLYMNVLGKQILSTNIAAAGSPA